MVIRYFLPLLAKKNWCTNQDSACTIYLLHNNNCPFYSNKQSKWGFAVETFDGKDIWFGAGVRVHSKLLKSILYNMFVVIVTIYYLKWLRHLPHNCGAKRARLWEMVLTFLTLKTQVGIQPMLFLDHWLLTLMLQCLWFVGVKSTDTQHHTINAGFTIGQILPQSKSPQWMVIVSKIMLQ